MNARAQLFVTISTVLLMVIVVLKVADVPIPWNLDWLIIAGAGYLILRQPKKTGGQPGNSTQVAPEAQPESAARQEPEAPQDSGAQQEISPRNGCWLSMVALATLVLVASFDAQVQELTPGYFRIVAIVFFVLVFGFGILMSVLSRSHQRRFGRKPPSPPTDDP